MTILDTIPNGASGLDVRETINGMRAKLPGRTTKRAMLAFGGSGAGSANASTADFTERLPVLLPVRTKRWRLRIANAPSGVIGAGAQAVKGVAVGKAVMASTGDPTGAIDGTVTTALGAFTTNSDGSDYVTAWVTDPDAQFAPNIMHMLSFGWTAPGATVVGRGSSLYWFRSGAGASDGFATANAGTYSTSGGKWFDTRLEYEFDGLGSVGLWVGDSQLEATTGSTSLATYSIYPHQAGFRSGSVACIACRGGVASSLFTSESVWEWQKLGTEITPDFGVIDLGINDAGASVTLATFQSNLLTIKNLMKSRYNIDRVFGATIAPRSYASPGSDANETLRLSYNAWLRTCPLGLVGILDFDRELRDPANVRNMIAPYPGSDNLHRTREAHQAEAMLAAAVLPSVAA